MQQISTGLFLGAENDWIGAREEAQGFSSAGEAIEFCVNGKITDVQLLKVSDAGDLYGYLQPFGGNDPALQSSDLDPAGLKLSAKRDGK